LVKNVIEANGIVQDLDLGEGDVLVVRNFNPEVVGVPDPIPVEVGRSMKLRPGGVLKLVLDADPWNSQIAFASSADARLDGGSLDLAFDDGVAMQSQIGRVFQLFDWNSTMHGGAFAFQVPAGTIWDLSQIYASGEATLTTIQIPGDVDGDGTVDLSDFSILKTNFGLEGVILTDGDLTGDFRIDLEDFSLLKQHFGEAAVPEPSVLALAVLGAALVGCAHRRLAAA
ncbi:MAG: hypothetical protein KDA61_23360, partial [Planctomycetales bacterium]|nr:hypothetical protein [Planctomycetales bacterium]